MIVDLFAGPGGWDLAARDLGLRTVGIELDGPTVRTRSDNGLATIRADLSTYRIPDIDLVGLIASPPCQSFSSSGPKTRDESMILRTEEWIRSTSPEWIALEQVVGARPAFRSLAGRLSDRYNVRTYDLTATDYSVHQRRVRTFLVASRTSVPELPSPTAGLLDRPLTLEELFPDRRGWTLDRRQRKNGRPVRDVRSDEVAPTLTAKGAESIIVWRSPDRSHHEPLRTSEILAIQGFPADFRSSCTRPKLGHQIGNAVPPAMARAVLSTLAFGGRSTGPGRPR